MPSVQGRLVERAEALGRLRGAADGVTRGSGVLALVSGEAGIGKTAVVRAFVHSLGKQWRVLTGGCDDLLTPRPLGALRDAARSGVAADVAAALETGSREEVLGAVLAELTDPSAPTLLLIEDVHWADDATVDVLRYVGRRIESTHALMVLTLRSDEVGRSHPLAALLGESARSGAVRIELSRLSVAGVAELAVASGVDPVAVHESTGGNPFFVSEVLAQPQVVVPDSVLDAVTGRLYGLPPESQRAVAALSVLPTAADLKLAGELVGDLEVLSEPERHGVVQVRDGTVGFRHELARRAVEQSMTRVERLAAHRAVLAALARRPDTDPAVVVHHAVEAGDVDTLLTAGPVAARAAARSAAHNQAVAQYAAVLRFRDHVEPAERAALLEEYAWELHHAHRFTEAAVAASSAVRLREELGDPPAFTRALVTWSRVAWLAGQHEVASAAVARASTVAELSGDIEGQALAGTYGGAMLVMAGRFDEAARLLPVALDLSSAAGRKDLQALCLTYQGHAVADTGQPGAVDLLERAVAIATAAHADEATARAYVNLAECLLLELRFEELEQVTERGLAVTRALDLAGPAYSLTCSAALARVARGRWDEAFGLLGGLPDHGDVGVLAWISRPLTGLLLARRGDPAAREWLTPMLDPAALPTSRHYARGVAAAVVEWCWLTGRIADARPVVTAALALPGPPGSPDYAELNRWLRRTGLAMGSVGVAQVPAAVPAPWRHGIAGDWLAAAEAWRALDVPYEQALELMDADEVDPVLQAIAILDRLGARPAAELARGRARRLGAEKVPRRPTDRQLANPQGLSERQLEVLALIADGLTNTEIGAKLYLSTRTVDHHVSAILTKLGVTNRKDAARAANDLR